jgi:N-methylhydantoinase B/oxoprolinase/acetone carboxylase alpha subunit
VAQQGRRGWQLWIDRGGTFTDVVGRRPDGRLRGAQGGLDGQPGINRIERADARVEIVGSCGRVELAAGDVFVIETPGAGGFGALFSSSARG